jgi:hypothetical protein
VLVLEVLVVPEVLVVLEVPLTRAPSARHPEHL